MRLAIIIIALSNLQAALGVAQIERIEEFLKAKKKNYLTYQEKIGQSRYETLGGVPDYADNNYWMYALQIKKEQIGKTREHATLSSFKTKNIQARPLWTLNHLQ